MKRSCSRLRERALRAGMDSRDAKTWRTHCESCPDCQTEQFLLETLQRQAQSERHHLGQREMAELLVAARRCQQRRSRVAPVQVWAWRVASVGLLVGITWYISHVADGRHQPQPSTIPLLAEAPGAACGNYGVPLFSASSEHDRAVHQRVNLALPAPLPGFGAGQLVQDLLLNLREEVEQRRQELMDLQDHDCGGWERDDAWELVLPLSLAVA